MLVEELVQRAALWPQADLPDPPQEHPYEVIRRDGFTVGIFRGLSFGEVFPEELAEGRIEHTLTEARFVLAQRGLQRGAWSVPEATRPAGLAARLRELGMVPADEPPLEPRFAAMLMLEEPRPGPSDVEARPARSFEEFQAGQRVANAAFDMKEEDRRAMEAHEPVMWELESTGNSPLRSFVGFVDGEVVGSAAAIQGANAVYLVGGSTREDMRGRGVYRALVRARWDAAVADGTPALTVTAGRFSRPILERLGFAIAGWGDCLLDRFD